MTLKDATRLVCAWRTTILTDERRDCLSLWVLRGGLVVLMTGWLVTSIAGQADLRSEAVGIARLEERMTAVERRSDSLDKRFDGLDTWLRGIFPGLAIQMAYQALQVGKKGGR